MSAKAPLVYRILLVLLPPRFRRDFGADLEAVLVERLRDARGAAACAWIWLVAIVDVFTSAPAEWAQALRYQRTGNATGGNGMETLIQDLRYAIRTLRRSPGFTAVAVATLALGIGGSAAIFTVVDSVLLRPLRFAEPERLTMIWAARRDKSRARVSPTYLHDWRLESRTFHDMAGWYDEPVNLTGAGEPLEGSADWVTANFFDVLGTPALLGHTFAVGAELSRVEPEVVLSYGLWQRRYGGDPEVIGQPITLDGESFTIIGIMPAGFAVRTVELPESRAELWLPVSLVPGDAGGMLGNLSVVARLAPGATIEQARSELLMISERIAEEHPVLSGSSQCCTRWFPDVVPLLEATVKGVRLALLVAFGAVGLLLLIACANVANLMLSRAVTRRAELAIRVSLGATLGRLARQLLTESLLLATIGGALGALLAVWGTGLLVSSLPAGLELPRTREIGVNLTVLGFVFLTTILATALIGLLPSLISTRWARRQPLLGQAMRGHRFDQGPSRLRHALIISEVALALVLLAGGGLLARSFWELSQVDPGFQEDHLLTMRTTLPASQYDTDDRIRAFGAELLERIENLPGVRAVGSINSSAVTGLLRGAPFDIVGRPDPRPDGQRGSIYFIVGGSYFEAMGIPLLKGRLFADADTEQAEPVFIIDEALARRDWPGQDPVGQRISYSFREGFSGEIIGVVGSVRHDLAADPAPIVYWWFPQAPNLELTIVARTEGDPAALAPVIAAQVTEIDPNQPVADIRTMQDVVSADVAQPRFTMLLLGSFAAAALLLAAIGLYGVIAFSVEQRTQEIGLRVALGAEQRDVLRLIMRQGLILTGMGLAFGLAAAPAVGRVVAGLLYRVAPTDSTTLLAVSLFLAAVALLATYLPAHRAVRLDPMIALRAE